MSNIAPPSPYLSFVRRISLLKKSLLALIILSIVFQVYFDPSPKNILCVFLVVSGSIAALTYISIPENLIKYPLSTLIAFGFAFTLLIGPIVFTSLEGKPVVYNLVVPEHTFAHSLALSLVAILSHYLYKNIGFFCVLEKVHSFGSRQARCFSPAFY